MTFEYFSSSSRSIFEARVTFSESDGAKRFGLETKVFFFASVATGSQVRGISRRHGSRQSELSNYRTFLLPNAQKLLQIIDISALCLRFQSSDILYLLPLILWDLR